MRAEFSSERRRRIRAWVLLPAAVLLAGAIAAPARAQGDWNRTDDPMQGAVGLHLGKIGGVGLAYKYPLQWWLNFQLAGGIWHTGQNKRHNLGFQFQYILRQDSSLRLYLGAGAGYFYHKESPDDSPEQVSDSWNTGFGVGLEFLRGERVSLQIEGDFTHESDDGDFIFFPQAAVYYYF